MCAGHRDDQVRGGGDLGLELPCREIRRVAAQFVEDDGRIRVNWVSDHRAGAGTGRADVGDPMLRSVGDGESLCGGRATDIASADEEDLQSKAPLCTGIWESLALDQRSEIHPRQGIRRRLM